MEVESISLHPFAIMAEETAITGNEAVMIHVIQHDLRTSSRAFVLQSKQEHLTFSTM